MIKSKGFTIIELIIVIAIIAILAGIIMVNVNTYIKKGNDSRILQQLRTVQTDVLSSAISALGITFTSATPCASNDSWTDITTNLQKGGATKATCAAKTTDGKFCACVQSLADTTKYYCVDNTQTKINTTTSCIVACTVATVTGVCP